MRLITITIGESETKGGSRGVIGEVHVDDDFVGCILPRLGYVPYHGVLDMDKPMPQLPGAPAWQPSPSTQRLLEDLVRAFTP